MIVSGPFRKIALVLLSITAVTSTASGSDEFVDEEHHSQTSKLSSGHHMQQLLGERNSLPKVTTDTKRSLKDMTDELEKENRELNLAEKCQHPEEGCGNSTDDQSIDEIGAYFDGDEKEYEEYWERSKLVPMSEEPDLELDELMLAIRNGEVHVSVSEEDHSPYFSTSVEEILEKMQEEVTNHALRKSSSSRGSHGGNSGNSRALVALNKSDVATLGDATLATANGDLELALDIVASTLVTGICLAVSWAAGGVTMGLSVAYAPLACAAAAFWSGIIFSAFDWIGGVFGTPSNDDAWWTVEAARSWKADGKSLGISYHRQNGDVDKDSLGYIKKGEVKTSREDLDASRLVAIEVRVEDSDDVCVKNMLFKVGREPSGTNRVEEIPISAPIISLLTQSKLHNTNEMCINFGDSEGAIGNFKFHWPSALKCHKNFGAYLTRDYQYCLTFAMYRFDVRRNGSYRRLTYSNSPSLPSYYSNPHQPIRSRGVSSLCFDVHSGKTTNGTPIILYRCHNGNNQRFDFDADGRLRSALDYTKCVEAGRSGELYAKLFLHDCHNGAWQQWNRYTDGRLQNKYHNKYIGTAYCKRERAVALELRWWEGGACGEAQKFQW